MKLLERGAKILSENNLPIVKQDIFPPVGTSEFTLLAEMAVYMGEGEDLDIEIEGVVGWRPESLAVMPPPPTMRYLLAKTELEAAIEETLYVFDDVCPEMFKSLMTPFKYVDESAKASAVYRLYAKSMDTDVAILPSAKYSVTATEFKENLVE